MLLIKARISFKPEEDPESLHKSGVSGMQPSFSVSDDRIMCRVTSLDDESEFVLGEEYQVSIELPYGEMYAEEITEGYRFMLSIGGREFASGVVL